MKEDQLHSLRECGDSLGVWRLLGLASKPSFFVRDTK